MTRDLQKGRGRRARWLVGLAVAWAAGAAWAADVPQYVWFQGRLPDAGSGPVNLRVRLWSDPTSFSPGDRMFQEDHLGVQLTDGVFSILIGEPSGGLTAAQLESASGEVWLGLAVIGDGEFVPRTRLASVPFAYKAIAADGLVAPGSADPVVVVEADRSVSIDGKVGLLKAGDGGGRVVLRNGSDVSTVRLDGEDGGDGRLDLYDADHLQAVRIHADRINDAPELAMFMGEAGGVRETVQLTARHKAAGHGAGGIVLRRIDDPAAPAKNTVELLAAGDNMLSEGGSGGRLQLNYVDGSPVFTVQAGSMGALDPAFIEFAAFNGSRRMYVTPAGLSFYDSSDELTINLGGSTGNVMFAGTTTTGVLTITGGSDLSEQFDISADDGAVEPGMVVSIDPGSPGKLVVCATAYDRTVAGVISGAGGVNTGMLMGQAGTIADGQHAVALTGRVWVLCDATEAAIEPGDLLTTSATRGHAMRAGDHERAQGAVIGKAMTRLAAGERGLVLVLVNLQ